MNRDGFSVARKGERGALCGIIFFVYFPGGERLDIFSLVWRCCRLSPM